MPLGTNPAFSAVKAFFAGTNNLSDYVRGGAYVPNIAANAAIGTTAATLRLSQFSGADKSTPTSLSASATTKTGYNSGAATSGGVSSFVTLTPSGGNGTYTWTAVVQSGSANTTGRTASVTGSGPTYSGNCSATVTGATAINGYTATGQVVVRYTATSNGTSDFVDVTYNFTWDNDNNPDCVVTVTKISPVSNEIAGDLTLDDELWITDPYMDMPEVTMGRVRKSKTVVQPCVRIVAANGTWLECSLSAPIATFDSGYVRAEHLKGLSVPTITADELAEGNMAGMEWSEIVDVIPIGDREVQHLYVENRAFWASGDGFRFVLHHNVKVIK